MNRVYACPGGFQNNPSSVEKFQNTLKETVKTSVILQNDSQLHDHVKTLVKQGHFADLLMTSHTDATWQSYIYDLPKGTMKFLLNSCLDTLPTLANLHQWGKSPTYRCPHCGNKQTTNHILNCCKTYLNDGRYL